MGAFNDFFKTLRYCKPYRSLYFWGVIALLFVDLLDVAAPKLIKWAVAAARGAQLEAFPSWFRHFFKDDFLHFITSIQGTWVFGLSYVGIVALTGFFRYWMSMNFARAANRAAHDMRRDFYQHVQNLPSQWHQNQKIGSLISLATNDTNACRMFWGIGMLLLFDIVFYLSFTPVMMISESLELTLLCMLPIPIAPFVVRAIARRIERGFDQVQEQFSTLSAQASESFSGVEVIQNFRAEKQQEKRYFQLSREFMRRSLRLAKVKALNEPTFLFFVGLMEFIVLLYGGYLTIAGKLQVEQFVAFFFYLSRLAMPMFSLSFVLGLYQQALASRKRLDKVFEQSAEEESTEKQVKENNQTRAASTLKNQATLKVSKLSFSYTPSSPQVLDNISFEVKQGECLGIVGEVGSGKSTLLKLLTRLYDPPPKSIFLHGDDIKNLSLNQLRQEIAVVPQEDFLFSGSVASNIAYGDFEHDQDKIQEVAKIAEIHQEISLLPEGYQTLIGERGLSLSGGQRQRLALARALYPATPILLLDDCFSAVDSETEAKIVNNLSTRLSNTCCILTSSRLSSVRNATQIQVLAAGKIIESGNHQSLLSQQGWYAKHNS